MAAPPPGRSSASTKPKKLVNKPPGKINALKEETRKMEERLAMLRVAMSEERQKWDNVPKRKDGTFWKSARPVKNQNYAEQVLEEQARPRPPRRTRPGSRADSRGSEMTDATPRAPLSDPYRLPLQPASSSSQVAPLELGSGTGAGMGMVQRTPSSASPGSLLSGSFDERAAHDGFAAARAAYLQQEHLPDKSADAGPVTGPGSLLQGAFDESESSNSFAEARLLWLAENAGESGGENVDLALAPSAPAPTSSRQLDFDSEERTVTPGGLLDGVYDEEANRNAFAEARQQWLDDQRRAHESKEATQSWNVERSQNGPSRPTTASKESRPVTARPKGSCYHCYKLHFADLGFKDASSSRMFCRESCARIYHLQNSIVCANSRCGANVARGSAALRDDGRFYCSDCDHNLSASAQHHANADRDTRPSPTTKAPPKVASEPLVSFPDESDEEEN